MRRDEAGPSTTTPSQTTTTPTSRKPRREDPHKAESEIDFEEDGTIPSVAPPPAAPVNTTNGAEHNEASSRLARAAAVREVSLRTRPSGAAVSAAPTHVTTTTTTTVSTGSRFDDGDENAVMTEEDGGLQDDDDDDDGVASPPPPPPPPVEEEEEEVVITTDDEPRGGPQPEEETVLERAEEEDEEVIKAPEEEPGMPANVTGPAADAINRSNNLPTDHRPRRTPWIVRYVGAHKKYIKKPERRRAPPKGKVIRGTDEQYVLTYAMRLGIQRSIDYASRALPDSFEAATKEKLVTHFPPGGSSETPAHFMKHPFSVVDYAPCVFSKIRHLMGVTDDHYRKSLCDSRLGFIKFIANSRSGQFFFYSNDHVFMIKTLRSDEKRFLLKLLPDYYAHLKTHSKQPDDDADLFAGSYDDAWFGKGGSNNRARQHPGAAGGGPSADEVFFDDENPHDDHGNTQRSRTARERPDVIFGDAESAQLLPDGLLHNNGEVASYVANNNASLLTRFYGLHCTRLRHLKRKVYFVVMASIYGGISYERMSIQYDLKGSSHNRSAKKGDFVQKDNDARQNRLTIAVGPERRRAAIRACQADADFLARNGVMDYSLLVGIYHLPVPVDDDDVPTRGDNSSTASLKAKVSAPPFGETAGDASQHNGKSAGGVEHHAAADVDETDAGTGDAGKEDDDDGRDPNENARAATRAPEAEPSHRAGAEAQVACYFLGIIDILQVYNFRKHVETDINIVSKGPRKYRDCSCVPPDQYRDRFIDFLRDVFV